MSSDPFTTLGTDLSFLKSPYLSPREKQERLREHIRNLGREARTSPVVNVTPLQTIRPDEWARMHAQPEHAESSTHAERPIGPGGSDSSGVEEVFPEPPPVVNLDEDDLPFERDEPAVGSGDITGEHNPEGNDAQGGDNVAEEAEGSSVGGSVGLQLGPDWEEVQLPKMGPERCTFSKAFDPDHPDRLPAFRAKYEIPDDVEIELNFGDRIYYSKEWITVPLMAITEGGLRFPLPKLVRQLLYYYELAPHQVVVNVYRVLSTVAKLAERHRIPVTIYDIMGIYTMGQHKASRRYYFTIRGEYNHLVTDLYDSERWQNEFVTIRGNYMWGPNEKRDWPVPQFRGDPSKPSAL
jgi:hypothetical protein